MGNSSAPPFEKFVDECNIVPLIRKRRGGREDGRATNFRFLFGDDNQPTIGGGFPYRIDDVDAINQFWKIVGENLLLLLSLGGNEVCDRDAFESTFFELNRTKLSKVELVSNRTSRIEHRTEPNFLNILNLQNENPVLAIKKSFFCQ